MRVSQIVGDERTNKLIIVADERSYEKMKRLILKLDVEIPDSARSTSFICRTPKRRRFIRRSIR